MEAERWDEARDLLAQSIERFGQSEPGGPYGAQFGAIYYRKGLCELKLQRWDEALKSFEICYRDFPAAAPGAGNPFQKMALLKSGEAAMGAHRWELAISQFEKFLIERDREHDVYPRGSFYLNLAICHYRLNRLVRGNENLEIALLNRATFPTPFPGIIAAFQELVAAAIRTEQSQTLLDFVLKNRSLIVSDPFAVDACAEPLMKLATDALAADMPRAALAIYELVPSVPELRAAWEKRLGEHPEMRQEAEERLAGLNAQEAAAASPQIRRLEAMAFLKEKLGDLAGARKLYHELCERYPQASARENHLFQCVRTSSLLRDTQATRREAEHFLDAFPEAKEAPVVRQLLLSAWFQNGDYEDCVERGAPWLEQGKEGVDPDFGLFAVAASQFYLKRHAEAQPLLDRHAERFPQSSFASQIAYFRAANLMAAGRWAEAAERLDAFLAAYPDPGKSALFPLALLERAKCHFAQGEFAKAEAVATRVAEEFAAGKIAGAANDVKNRAAQALRETSSTALPPLPED